MEGNIRILKTTRGKQKLIDTMNYIYVKNKSYKEKTYWVCENGSCRARLHTILDGEHHKVVNYNY